jgi:hypothetical protein
VHTLPSELLSQRKDSVPGPGPVRVEANLRPSNPFKVIVPVTTKSSEPSTRL